MTETVGRADQVNRVGIVGGGTAGYLTALAFKKQRPDVDVTIIESSRVPAIGVGEGTTPLMVAFLHGYLGIDPDEFVAAVRPTWKVGVRLLWGREDTGQFDFAFDATHVEESYVHDGTIDKGSLGAHVMAAEGSLQHVGADLQTTSLATRIPYAYHIDNGRLLTYLRAQASAAGVPVLDAHIVAAKPGPEGVASLIADDGRELAFDLYIDCSGFRSLLLGEACGSQRIDFSQSLPTDRALVATVGHDNGFGPYTTAETMQAGWCWGLPQQESNHRGYVYCSAHLSADEAEAEMRAANPTMGEVRELKFSSGRRAEWWKDNVVGVGNAYAFVEPLEATSLHMIVREIAEIVANVDTAPSSRAVRDQLNASIGEAWDYLRDYLAVHYRFNRRVDSAFWRECRSSIDVGHLEPLVQRLTAGDLHEQGDLNADSPAAFVLGDRSVETALILLGQQAVHRDRCRSHMSSAQWRSRRDRLRRIARRTVPASDVLQVHDHHTGLADPRGAAWFEHLTQSLYPVPA